MFLCIEVNMQTVLKQVRPLSLFQSGDTTVLEVQEGHRLGSVGLAHIKDQQQT